MVGLAYTKPGLTKIQYETLSRIFSEKEELADPKVLTKVSQIEKAS